MLKVRADDIMRTPWMWDCEPFHIVDNLYYVGNKDVSIHLFDTGEGLLILDTSYPQSKYQIFESIRAMGFDPKDIKWILHSHGHWDHFGGTRVLVEKYGCKTYFPEEDLPFLNERKDLNWHEEFNENFEPPYDGWFQPDVLMKGGDVLTFGNTKVEVYNQRGHTAGCLAFRFILPGGLKAAMLGGIGFNTLSSAYAKRKNLGTSWRDVFISDLRKLYGLEVDIMLGNHPDQTKTFEKKAGMTETENPFINPNAWDPYLSRLEKRFLDMVEKDPIE